MPCDINYLRRRLDRLHQRQKELKKLLEYGFDPGLYRRLNIINHSINVTNERIDGTWNREKQITVQNQRIKNQIYEE